jgi:hypothetical protein
MVQYPVQLLVRSSKFSTRVPNLVPMHTFQRKLFIRRCRPILVYVYDDRIFKRRSIFEICRFVYDICYNAYRHDSRYGQIRRQHELLFSPVPEEGSEQRERVREGEGIL